ncbi:MAG: phosphoesterase [Desulfamplus sp.]|nr:phosphoesterase [Desulfamplus sp.]
MEVPEYVLSIARASLPQAWVGERVILPMEEELFFDTCNRAGFVWTERSKAESDPSLKQIIPYVLVRTLKKSLGSNNKNSSGSNNKKLLVSNNNCSYIAIYKRRGSEKRLHDLHSVGIGGHINPQDAHARIPQDTHARIPQDIHSPFLQDTHAQTAQDFKEILISGMMRELDEEFLNMPREAKPVFRGIINEELTPVGKVHIGALFLITTDSPESFVPAEELADFRWAAVNDLGELKLELWSTMAIEML